MSFSELETGHMVEEGSSLRLYLRIIILFKGEELTKHRPLPKVAFPNSVTLDIRSSHMSVERETNIHIKE